MTSTQLKNVGAIAYTCIMYALGISLIIAQAWQWNVLGVVLLVHTLVLSATLTHEFIHGNIFKDRQLNVLWGRVMTHLNGGCYATWDALVEHHFNHHLHHADFTAFDYSKHFHTMHPWLRFMYIGLEWLYFPAFEFELRWRVILAPWLEIDQQPLRQRAIALMFYRTALFALLAYISWKALLLYFIAYISFVNIMRFADAFHHTYDYVVVGQEFLKRDRTYEQDHTFSNLISVHYPWLNLLFLNFGYHNAHHHNMSCPWHELPDLHQKLYCEQGGGLLPMPQLVGIYHRLRLHRLFAGQGDAILNEGAMSNGITGGVGVSFLTPP